MLKARIAETAEAEARLRAAEVYPYNPEIELERGRREAEGPTGDDSGVELSQEIEIAGQTRGRTRAARSDLEAARELLARERQAIMASVRSAFADAVRARDLLAVEESDEEIARRFLETAEKRDASGAGDAIELNLARAGLGRAELRARQALAEYRVARSLLAQEVALNPIDPPAPDGEVDVPAPSIPLADIVRRAQEARPDLAALRRQKEAAALRVEAARREAVPNLTLRLFDEREGDEDVRGAAISLPIPVFNRNQGAIAEARAAEDRLGWEARQRELLLQQEIVAAHATFEAASSAVRSIEERVVGTLEENLRLLERAYDAGKIGFTEILLIRRELVEARREYVEARSDMWQAAIALALASGADVAGSPPSPDGSR